jgi:hypothetical protein
MNWLAQNWGWVVLALAAIWLIGRGRLGACGMGGHGGDGTGAADASSRADAAQREGSPSGTAAEQSPKQQRRHGC